MKEVGADGGAGGRSEEQNAAGEEACGLSDMVISPSQTMRKTRSSQGTKDDGVLAMEE